MKKLFHLAAVIITATIGFTSCQKEGAKLYEVEIEVNYPEGYSLSIASDVLVTITNTSTAQEDTIRTDEFGFAKIKLAEGNYNMAASIETDEFYFNGTTQNLFVVASLNTFKIDLVASSKGGGLIFKEIYYCGSKTEALTNYNADQFVEIYNNSDVIQYLDGLCIGVLEPIPSATATAVWVDGSGVILDKLPVTFQALMFPEQVKHIRLIHEQALCWQLMQ